MLSRNAMNAKELCGVCVCLRAEEIESAGNKSQMNDSQVVCLTGRYHGISHNKAQKSLAAASAMNVNFYWYLCDERYLDAFYIASHTTNYHINPHYSHEFSIMLVSHRRSTPNTELEMFQPFMFR